MESIDQDSPVNDLPEHESLDRTFREPIDEVRFGQAIATLLPIELEIGSGKGLFLTNAAQSDPSRFFIGLELAAKYAREAQSKLERLKIQNAVFIASDATRVIATEVPDESLVAVHVYFPDPWWKAKHKKRRVLSDETIVHIERVLKPHGELHFWTDVLDYYEIAVPRIRTRWTTAPISNDGPDSTDCRSTEPVLCEMFSRTNLSGRNHGKI